MSTPADWDDGDIFEEIARERRALADVLQGLDEQQWATQSLCSGWSVGEVAAHLVVPLITPMWRFGLTMLRAGGNFDRANHNAAVAMQRKHGREVARILRQRATSRFTPPGYDARAPLTDVVVHGLDVCVPLGIDHPVPEPSKLAVLAYLTTPKNGIARYVPGVRWEATDVGWTAGEGAAGARHRRHPHAVTHRAPQRTRCGQRRRRDVAATVTLLR